MMKPAASTACTTCPMLPTASGFTMAKVLQGEHSTLALTVQCSYCPIHSGWCKQIHLAIRQAHVVR